MSQRHFHFMEKARHEKGVAQLDLEDLQPA